MSRRRDAGEGLIVRTADLQYGLPAGLIAQTPAERRDRSRLLLLNRTTGQRIDECFANLPALLPAGALLVLNDTRVLPARLALRRTTGGKVEGMFLSEPRHGEWEIMLTSSARLRPGQQLLVEGSARSLRLIERTGAGTWRATPLPADDAHSILQECGRPPLPPYIRRDNGAGQTPTCDDAERYQTVYARQPGAVAAPTAGLHFTPEVFAGLRAAGVAPVYVTLHVGVGTFAPIRCADLADHAMHAEWYDCPAPTAAAINAARRAAKPVVAVGTTSARVLETCADETGWITPGTGWTNLFIYPPYRFRAADALLTNFHLPGSTLLAMVFAFAGRQTTLDTYQHAVANNYRFYSYGDAMLLL